MTINDPNPPGGEASHERTAVIGAGVIGSVIAWALAREGRKVVLIDRAPPALGGASFGNAGYIATEQVQPLPSAGLLLTFWRELFAFGGPLAIPPARWPALAPWIAGFVRAAFQQRRNTPALASLVRPAADRLDAYLQEIGRRELLSRRGHYSVWLGPRSATQAARAMREAHALEVRTERPPQPLLQAVAARAGVESAAGCHYPDGAHVLDPRRVACAFVDAAVAAGATFMQTEVRDLFSAGSQVVIQTESETFPVPTAVVCAGVESAPLLARFGLRAPLAAERGYHVEMPSEPPLANAPVHYCDYSIVVTPMDGRLRATSYLELQRHGAPADARKFARLRRRLRGLGYHCADEPEGWVGSRPTLPDYLPGIGRAPGEANLFYATGHQHLGLTLAAPTAEVMAALVAGRAPPIDVRPFDLARFGRPARGAYA